MANKKRILAYSRRSFQSRWAQRYPRPSRMQRGCLFCSEIRTGAAILIREIWPPYFPSISPFFLDARSLPSSLDIREIGRSTCSPWHNATLRERGQVTSSAISPTAQRHELYACSCGVEKTVI